MLKNKKVIFLAAMILGFAANADEFFKKQDWKTIKEVSKPPPKKAQYIPEINSLPESLKDKIETIESKGLKLEFVTYPSGQSTKMKSCANIAFDSKNLYVELEGEQGKDYKLRATHQEKETAHIWYDDNFEAFIDPFLSRNEYAHFIVNPLAESYQAQCFIKMIPDPKAADQSVMTSKLESDISYSSGAKTEVFNEKRKWAILLSIPFSSFGINAPPLGQAWGFNFCHTNREIKELSQWKVTSGDLGFHTPEKYGVLIFGDKKPCVESEFSWSVPGYGKNSMTIKSKNPSSPLDATASFSLTQKGRKTISLAEKKFQIGTGATENKVSFSIPFDINGKFKIAARLAGKDETMGYFLKNMTLETPMTMSAPLTQIYTSDSSIKGSLKLFLGNEELKKAILRFEISQEDKIIKTQTIKKLPGNYLEFAIFTKGLNQGTYKLVSALEIDGKTVKSSKIKFEILEAPFPF
jgi:hypothetical protein